MSIFIYLFIFAFFCVFLSFIILHCHLHSHSPGVYTFAAGSLFVLVLLCFGICTALRCGAHSSAHLRVIEAQLSLGSGHYKMRTCCWLSLRLKALVYLVCAQSKLVECFPVNKCFNQNAADHYVYNICI